MGKRPVRSAAVHSLRETVQEREEPGGKAEEDEARRELTREGGDLESTRPRQDEGTFFREEAIPLRRVSRCPKDVERESGG